MPVVSGGLWYIERECMNMIRIYEQAIRELLGFYVFRDVGNKIKFIAYFIQWYLCYFYTC